METRFEARFNYLLKETGKTKGDIARKIDVDPSTVTKWIQEPSRISTADLKKIGGLIGLREEELQELIELREEFIAQKTQSRRANYGHPLPAYDENSPPPHQSPLFQPPRVEHFIGRKKEIVEIIKKLQPGKVVALTGPGGIGKTVIAYELIRVLTPNNRLPTNFPGGIGFHDFYKFPDVDEAFKRLAWQFGVKASEFPNCQQALIHALFDKQVLIFLDGVDKIRDDLSLVLPVLAKCGVLLTSQLRLHGGKAYADLEQEIRELRFEDAVPLLQKWSEGQIEDSIIAGEICNLLGRLPLALVLAGQYMAAGKASGLRCLNMLKNTELLILDIGKRQHESIPVLFRKTLERIKPEARKVLEVVGLLNQTGFATEIIEEGVSTSGERAVNVTDLLAELVNYHLLDRDDHTDLYEVAHPLVHVFAQSELKATDEVLQNLVNHFTRLVYFRVGLGKSSPPEIELLDKRLNIAKPHMVELLKTCLKRKQWPLAERLARTVDLQFSTNHKYINYVQDRKRIEGLANLSSNASQITNPPPISWEAFQTAARELSDSQGQLVVAIRQVEDALDQNRPADYSKTMSYARELAKEVKSEESFRKLHELEERFYQRYHDSGNTFQQKLHL